MRKWIASAALFVVALGTRAFSQIPMGGITGGGSSPLSCTLVQHPHNSSCGSSATTCAITLTQSIASGDYVSVWTTSYNNRVITATDNGGTFIPLVGTSNDGGAVGEMSGGYIYPASAEATTLTVTESGTTGGGAAGMVEMNCTGATPQIDGENSIVNNSNATSLVFPTFTPSTGSTQDTAMGACGAGYYCTAISSPFTLSPTGNNSFAWDWLANSTGWTGPTYTLYTTAGESQAAQVALGSNVTPFSNQMFVNFNGTPGSAITVAQIQSDMLGYQGAWPVINGTAADLTIQTSASQPLQNPTGRLGDGGNYTDLTTTGLQYATTNNATNIQWGLTAASWNTYTVSVGLWYLTTLPGPDSSVVDSISLNAGGGSSYINFHTISGNSTGRETEAECLSASGGTGTGAGGTYNIPTNTWAWVFTRYADFPQYTLTAASAASGGSTTYTGTFAQGGSNGLAGLTFNIQGFTNSGNNGDFVVTGSTGTTLTVTNSGGVLESHSGLATSDHEIDIYNSANPPVLQQKIVCTSRGGGYRPGYLIIGDAASGALTSGYVINFDSLKLSLDSALVMP
jgi:hypothetical protein